MLTQVVSEPEESNDNDSHLL
ncbi:protein of unknown function (plasmid) [Cupriavidus taiwanensis]|uniref:Uncharacterized protein n=1 Tax=Cupriavidus taiwanensis TaxID=164546 RepID=A0A7Z7JE84_9BURK|nr:protein of unknown function [Cupriavidus taiwanensis]SOZ11545.1 protein of unknown function [Cupriavidus taiwanensis]SOZ42900.1 protein of unknown function [Cupriavidus taiwanensis]SPC22147.1 protein of unknown function [Cupriavidus taiwanensis]SPD53650.1 protein of unknown function [Cupriavidus taiwanensis]